MKDGFSFELSTNFDSYELKSDCQLQLFESILITARAKKSIRIAISFEFLTNFAANDFKKSASYISRI